MRWHWICAPLTQQTPLSGDVVNRTPAVRAAAATKDECDREWHKWWLIKHSFSWSGSCKLVHVRTLSLLWFLTFKGLRKNGRTPSSKPPSYALSGNTKPAPCPVFQTEIMAGILFRIKKLPEKNSVCSESSHPYLITVIVGVIYEAVIICFSEAFVLKLAQECVSESFTRQSLVLLPRVPTIKKQRLSNTQSYMSVSGLTLKHVAILWVMSRPTWHLRPQNSVKSTAE